MVENPKNLAPEREASLTMIARLPLMKPTQ